MVHDFVADYSSYILRQLSGYILKTEEPTDVIILTLDAVDWESNNMK